MKIMLGGGGTGGHIVPLIPLVRELRRKWQGTPLQFLYLGPKDDFSQVLLSQESVPVATVFAGKIRRYGGFKPWLQNLLDITVKMPLGILQAFVNIFLFSPDVIFSKGGYGALPCTIAGWMLRVPVFLHESDARPGLSNIFASRFALKVFTSFPKTPDFPERKVIETGNLIRREILTGNKEEARGIFKLAGDKPLLLIVGGSQGSQRLNDMVLTMLGQALEEFEILHQVGEKNIAEIQAQARTLINLATEKYYHPVGFLRETDLRHAYAAADLVVSRAGSSAVFELAALGKPSILVPLPEAAQNHQIYNAYEYARTGAALVLEEPNLTPNFFLEKLRYLFSHKEEMEKMSKAARAFGKPEAASHVANFLIEYLKK